jgi:hypothetical protein
LIPILIYVFSFPILLIFFSSTLLFFPTRSLQPLPICLFFHSSHPQNLSSPLSLFVTPHHLTDIHYHNSHYISSLTAPLLIASPLHSVSNAEAEEVAKVCGVVAQYSQIDEVNARSRGNRWDAPNAAAAGVAGAGAGAGAGADATAIPVNAAAAGIAMRLPTVLETQTQYQSQHQIPHTAPDSTNTQNNIGPVRNIGNANSQPTPSQTQARVENHNTRQLAYRRRLLLSSCGLPGED